MRRAPVVLGATAAGLAGVLAFHTHSAPLALSGLSTAGGATSTSTATASSGSVNAKTSPTSASTTTTTPQSASPSSTTTAPRATTTTTPSATTVPSTTTTTTPKATRSATGPSVNYSYGDLSVTVTASGSKITNVTIASLDDDGNFRSQQIDEYSIPILEQQAISAQSASIDGVSGATYTSQGFQQSLQGALSKLGL
jgi:uncharacterized protein with FMN-binding domain